MNFDASMIYHINLEIILTYISLESKPKRETFLSHKHILTGLEISN